MYAFTNEVALRFGVEPSTVVLTMLIGGALLYVLIVAVIIMERREQQAIGAARARRLSTQGRLRPRNPPKETQVEDPAKQAKLTPISTQEMDILKSKGGTDHT
jgi:hypothetical protein